MFFFMVSCARVVAEGSLNILEATERTLFLFAFLLIVGDSDCGYESCNTSYDRSDSFE